MIPGTGDGGVLERDDEWDERPDLGGAADATIPGTAYAGAATPPPPWL